MGSIRLYEMRGAIAALALAAFLVAPVAGRWRGSGDKDAEDTNIFKDIMANITLGDDKDAAFVTKVISKTKKQSADQSQAGIDLGDVNQIVIDDVEQHQEAERDAFETQQEEDLETLKGLLEYQYGGDTPEYQSTASPTPEYMSGGIDYEGPNYTPDYQDDSLPDVPEYGGKSTPSPAVSSEYGGADFMEDYRVRVDRSTSRVEYTDYQGFDDDDESEYGGDSTNEYSGSQTIQDFIKQMHENEEDALESEQAVTEAAFDV